LDTSSGLATNTTIRAIPSLLWRKQRQYWDRVQYTVFSSSIENLCKSCDQQ
jgi:hypothetical protein